MPDSEQLEACNLPDETYYNANKPELPIKLHRRCKFPKKLNNDDLKQQTRKKDRDDGIGKGGGTR